MFFTEIKNMNASFVTRYVQKDQIFTNISKQFMKVKHLAALSVTIKQKEIAI